MEGNDDSKLKVLTTNGAFEDLNNKMIITSNDMDRVLVMCQILFPVLCTYYVMNPHSNTYQLHTIVTCIADEDTMYK